jgi:adenine-specific DNA-methyltransferase
MSRLSDLLRAASQLDPQLAKDLQEEIQPLQKRLRFGLNFERHAPEAVELAGHKVRKGSKVRVLPPRGSTDRGDRRLWRVDAISGDQASIVSPNGDEAETAVAAVDDLLLVAEFRDRIYPGLRPDGEVLRGGDKPSHTVINGENFHVLEQLTFTHEGAVDAIYIDPPYNTGARDWKYNNDYVEGDDLYRHSKWLAFMERRLKIAKRLLKPNNSILIVSIDEKEYLRLGLLLEQTFPSARVQMVSTVINPKGAARASAFGRTDEYVYFVMIGEAGPAPSALSPEWKVTQDARASKLRWAELLRSGSNTRREDSANQFYPVYVRNTPEGPVFDSIGEPFYGVDRSAVAVPDGCVAVWPLRSDGSEGNWQVSVASLKDLIDKGYARLGLWRSEKTAISYLKRGEASKVATGIFPVMGRKQDGSVVTDATEYKPTFIPGTQWRLSSHNAEQGGTNLLKSLIPTRKFPFPKSLYAVEDALRFFVSDKPDAVIVDFFAGSGTTAHAVMRLNRQDGGQRQCISVTNNEVSADEQAKLRSRGLRPGDEDWERWGICDYITKPRIRAAITGRTAEGNPVNGEYKFVDEFAMAEGFEENASFFTLTYESPFMVSTDRAFAAIAPMLWLRAGARGSRIDHLDGGFAVEDCYGVLRDLDQTATFLDALRQRPGLRIAYIVTDDEGRYQQVASELPHIETVRLYEDYLRNCESTGDL